MEPSRHGDAVATVAARIEREGRTAWPGVDLSARSIADSLAARLAIDRDLGLDQLCASDLYLALALEAGLPEAVRAFEKLVVPQVDVALRRFRAGDALADEVKQRLRVELLVGPDPGICHYTGRGELAAWVRVIATRMALKLTKKAGREEPLDELLLGRWAATTADVGVVQQRETYAIKLKQALGEAFASLEVRQRNLLRQHVLDELTIDDLARLYRVHRATCARWLAEARADLSKHTRRRLAAALGADREELESVLRFLDTDIELSISRILRS